MSEGGQLGLTADQLSSFIPKLKDDDYHFTPFQDLEKSAVLQECRLFQDPNAVKDKPYLCSQLITKLLHILMQGDTFTSDETSDVFFGVTHLFQSQNTGLRRMVYLFIKEVAETCNPDDVIIVTSSLTKDMNTNTDLYKGNASRVLSRIIDPTVLTAIERYFKQNIVDKNPLVASSGLIAGLHLYQKCPEIIRRWVNEVQEAVKSDAEMVQYHALSLLYEIKQKDRLAVSKLVSQLMKGGTLKSPLALCLLIRYSSILIQDDLTNGNGSVARQAAQFLEASLRHRNESVVYEAAKAICNLPTNDARDLTHAINVLQLFLGYPKPTFKYCAMKTLNEVASKHPLIIAKCNEDIESLIGDSNRPIATLAITTLLKTGDESSVDRLLKQIATFMSDIEDEFRILIVDSIKKLCLKYPHKHGILIGFLANYLREEGGFEYKKKIVDSIVDLIYIIKETKESSLFHLCDFIEDCEFTELSTQILYLIGNIGPTTNSPARYIRFVYNRIILENALVRAAAVSTLTKFGVQCESLRDSIVVLLKRSMLDEDDEVRDRITIALSVLETEETTKILSEPPVSFNSLEKSIKSYESYPPSTDSAPLEFATLPTIEESEDDLGGILPDINNPSTILQAQNKSKDSANRDKSSQGGSHKRGDSNGSLNNTGLEEEVNPHDILYAIPEIAELGRIFRSTPPVALTENETEYVVNCTKHIFVNHIVLQFQVNNTIPEQQLVDVKVDLEGSNTDLFIPRKSIAASEVKFDEPAFCYTIIERNLEETLSQESFHCNLIFRVVEVDPTTGEVDGDPTGFEEEYQLEDLDIDVSDFMSKISLGNFRVSWDGLGDENEAKERFQLPQKTLEEGVAAVIKLLGMQPCDGTHQIKQNQNPGKDGKLTHDLRLSGVFVGGKQVLVWCKYSLLEGQMIFSIKVRSQEKALSQLVTDCIQ